MRPHSLSRFSEPAPTSGIAGLAPRLLGASVAEDKLKTAPRLSIVVLPFENLGGDPDQDYFADGITDDLTTDLSHIPESVVISRKTAFTYKGKPIDAKAIGRDLGVRYLLEGSVRRSGEKIAVNAQLISTETGAHVWADRFEGERANLGQLQVDIVSRLANSLGVELVKAESLRSMRERPDNPDAADLAMQGWALINQVDDKERFNDGMKLFERALALDPQNVQAMTGLASVLQWRAFDGWSDDWARDFGRAEGLIKRALVLQPENSMLRVANAQNLAFKRPMSGGGRGGGDRDRLRPQQRARLRECRLLEAIPRPQRGRHRGLSKPPCGSTRTAAAFRGGKRSSAAPTTCSGAGSRRSNGATRPLPRIRNSRMRSSTSRRRTPGRATTRRRRTPWRDSGRRVPDSRCRNCRLRIK